jgi:hypothetical protein
MMSLTSSNWSRTLEPTSLTTREANGNWLRPLLKTLSRRRLIAISKKDALLISKYILAMADSLLLILRIAALA